MANWRDFPVRGGDVLPIPRPAPWRPFNNDPDYSPQQYEGSAKKGEFTNCGYHGTASGWIIRDGTHWIATFRSEADANQYVAFRNALSAGEKP